MLVVIGIIILLDIDTGMLIDELVIVYQANSKQLKEILINSKPRKIQYYKYISIGCL